MRLGLPSRTRRTAVKSSCSSAPRLFIRTSPSVRSLRRERKACHAFARSCAASESGLRPTAMVGSEPSEP
eukprot:14361657-Alexandrium_andersonii.AAC.1